MGKIVFTGGGTLGHVMPNLFLIEDLQNNEITYIGSNGIEQNIVPKYVENFKIIPATKFNRGKFLVNFKIPFVLIDAIKKSKKILKEVKPDVIFSKGGYVSLPVCLAARKLRIPIIAHESDSSFGLANKIILKLCNTMCVNFKTLENKNKKIVYTGPILSEKFDVKTKKTNNLSLDNNKKTILIVGGSLGSKIINDNVYANLKDLLKKFNIIHITGKNNKKINSFDNYNAFEMTDDIVNFYNIADFVIGRSGAGVTAECFYKKLPMLLIPLENKSSRGDQVLNADYYKKLGVADILSEKVLNPTNFVEKINIFNKNLTNYKNNYRNLETINGRQTILKMINQFIDTNKN